MQIKHFLLWLPMIVLAFANATIREIWLIKYYSELRASQLSTISLVLFCAIYIWFIMPVLNIQNSIQAFLIGLIWVILTIVFEFALGRLTNRSWEFLLQNYNVAEGRLWPLFLLCLFLFPYLFYLIRK